MTDRPRGSRRTPALARAFCVWAAFGAAGAQAADIVAFRGGAGLYPANTRAAFAGSLSTGVDGLHAPVAMTKDDVPVVSSRLALDGDATRGPDGTWLGAYEPPVRGFTFQELQGFDIGRINPNSARARRAPEQTPIDGAPPIALAEVYELVRRARNRTVEVYVEALGSPFERAATPPPLDYVKTLLLTIGARRRIDQTILMARDWTLLAAARAREERLRTACATVEAVWLDTVQRGAEGASPWLGGVDVDDHASLPDAVQAAGCAIWAPQDGSVRADEIARAQAIGLRVALWPVDASGAMRLRMDQGVDALFTSRPDVMRQLIIERGEAPPPRTLVR